jgi:outer membrane murein-binding lipoprotein Lpp
VDRTDRALQDLRVDEAIELLGLVALAHDIAAINRKVNRIMASLADLETRFDTLRTDVTRALGDLKNAVDRLNSGDLPPASQAVVDDIAAKLDDLDAAVNSADPAAPAEPPADQSGAVDQT